MSACRCLLAVLVGAVFAVAAPAARAQCTGDIVEDGRVDGGDLGVLLAYWGPRTAGTWSIASDLNRDGSINADDLGMLLAAWGSCPVAPVNVPAWATLVQGPPDPMVVTDPTLRQAIADTGWAWRVRDTATQIEMLLVPPGTFMMGCITGSAEHGCSSPELPVHSVTLTDPFYLGRYEVTQLQWLIRTYSNPSWFRSQPDSLMRPVEQVCWDGAQSFLAAAGMRLPTEAEWEFACRAGTQTPYYNGSTDDATLGSLAWYALNTGETRPIGTKAANALGFHDMLGNVKEMTSDWWGAYVGMPQTNPTGPSFGQQRVTRGGGWGSHVDAATVSARGGVSPSMCGFDIGFRVARNP